MHLNLRSNPRGTSTMDSTLNRQHEEKKKIINPSRSLSICYQQQWSPIRIGLDLLNTYLSFSVEWSRSTDGHEGVPEHLVDLQGRLESAFESTEGDIKAAIEKGCLVELNALRSSLMEKIDHFKPQVRDAYNLLSRLYSSIRVTVISVVYGCLLSNCQNLYSGTILRTPEFNQLEHAIKFLQNHDVMFRRPNHGGLYVCLARLLFLCWADQGGNMPDVVQVISPELVSMYLEVISSHYQRSQKGLIEEFVGIITLLFQGESGELQPLRDCLVFLTGHLLQSQDKHDLDGEIKSFISDAASHSSSDALCGLIHKGELLKMHIFLMELGDSDTDSKARFESVYHQKGPEFHIAYPEKMMTILRQMEVSIRRTDSSSIGDILHGKVRITFYLIVFQAFLMELRSSSSSLIVVVKDQIEMLTEGSKLFHKYSSILPFKNSGDMELILDPMAGATCSAETLYDFFHSNKVTEQNIKKMSVMLSKFLEKFRDVNTKMQGIYLQYENSAMLTFPRSGLPGLAFIDSLLERLSRLPKTSSNGHYIEQQTEELLVGFKSLRSFLKLVEEKENANPELTDLVWRVKIAAYQADYIMDTILLLEADNCRLLWLSNVTDEVNLVCKDIIKCTDQMKEESVEVQHATQYDPAEAGEILVSLDDQERIITDKLLHGTPHLSLIGIVGMPGMGKSTLAKMVYKRPNVKNHFGKIAWCSISQDYKMREALLQILRDIDGDMVGKLQLSDDESDEELLAGLLRWNLKGKRYLIVMDDIWQEDVWHNFKLVLPSDRNGSRILFTTRIPSLFPCEDYVFTHSLRLLSCEESWMLLKIEVFGFGKDKEYPAELIRYGSVIAESCRGLPLLVVAVADLLNRSKRDVESWKQMATYLTNHALEDPQNQMYRVLNMIYNHLPDHLKPCLLYFTAFQEDQEIPVKWLIRLWRAEGFIRNQEPGEDLALAYLDELIKRSLIIVAKRGSNKRVKACKILNQLRHFCFLRAEEDNFFRSVSGYDKYYPLNTVDHGSEDLMPTPSSTIVYDTEHRLRICSKRSQFVRLEPSGQSVRTLLFAATSDEHPTCAYDLSFIPRKFPLLRVLDMESINMGSFLEGIQLLHPLRYLAVGGDIESVPSTIQKLHNLETFIVTGLKGNVELPATIWSMPSLWDLQVSPGAWFNNLQEESPSQANNLQTFSSPILSNWMDIEEIMKKAPQLKKLRCIFSPHQLHSQKLFDQQVLVNLESLRVLYKGRFRQSWDLSFPSNLHKLSLHGFGLTQECMSSIAKLRRLEALTLGSISFNSLTWEMGSDDKFPVLKTLKLYSLLLLEWSAYSHNFPSLERLVLRSCKHLQEIPCDFVRISSLRMIELKWCCRSAEISVKGYDNVKLKINAMQ